ncbi:MAG: hypothetical protein ACLPVY_09290 [Acidimicrobiia bacterium]
MSFLRSRIRRDERGASLVLAIALMLVAGAIGAGLAATVESGVNDSTVLAIARNREYSADGAIEHSIAQARANGGFCPAATTTWPSFDGFIMRVDCDNAPAVVISATGTVVAQRDLIFSACDSTTGTTCTETNIVIRARINYSSSGIPPEITKTYVQAWSVNG